MAQAKRREASSDRRRWPTVLGAWHCETARILLDSPGVQAALLFAEESQESKSQEAGKWRKQERDGSSYDLRDESATS